MMLQRKPGLDIIRCMGLLFVTGVHSFLYNGFYSQPQMGVWMWGANSFRWLFYTCNGIFMTLTGYLKCEKELNADYYKGLLPVLLGYFLTCCVSFPIRHFLIGEELPLWQWIEKLVTFGNYAWYVEMYLGLMLFAPVINLTLKLLPLPRQQSWLLGTMLLLTALPSVFSINLIPDYWTALYPVTYYVIGAYIKKRQPVTRSWLCLTIVAMLAMVLGAVSLLSTDKGFSKGFTQGYGGFYVTAMVLFLFLGLYRVEVGKKTAKVLAWLSGGCFEGYILSRLLDVWIYKTVPQWHTPEKYPLIFLCITLPVFVISLLAGKCLHSITARLCRKKQKQERVYEAG